MTTAVNIFIRQSVRQGGIPFEITTQTDAFHNPDNIKKVAATRSPRSSNLRVG